jgi:hypothetical protein
MQPQAGQGDQAARRSWSANRPRNVPCCDLSPLFSGSHRAGGPGAKTCRSSPTRRQRLGSPPRVASPTPQLCTSAHSGCCSAWVGQSRLRTEPILSLCKSVTISQC